MHLNCLFFVDARAVLWETEIFIHNIEARVASKNSTLRESRLIFTSRHNVWKIHIYRQKCQQLRHQSRVLSPRALRPSFWAHESITVVTLTNCFCILSPWAAAAATCLRKYPAEKPIMGKMRFATARKIAEHLSLAACWMRWCLNILGFRRPVCWIISARALYMRESAFRDYSASVLFYCAHLWAMRGRKVLQNVWKLTFRSCWL